MGEVIIINTTGTSENMEFIKSLLADNNIQGENKALLLEAIENYGKACAHEEYVNSKQYLGDLLNNK